MSKIDPNPMKTSSNTTQHTIYFELSDIDQNPWTHPTTLLACSILCDVKHRSPKSLNASHNTAQRTVYHAMSGINPQTLSTAIMQSIIHRVLWCQTSVQDPWADPSGQTTGKPRNAYSIICPTEPPNYWKKKKKKKEREEKKRRKSREKKSTQRPSRVKYPGWI